MAWGVLPPNEPSAQPTMIPRSAARDAAGTYQDSAGTSGKGPAASTSVASSPPAVPPTDERAHDERGDDGEKP